MEVEGKKSSSVLKRFKVETEDVKKFQGPYINTWLRLLAYIVIVFLTGCIYWGWNGIQELLYKGGAFEEVCIGASDISHIKIGNMEYIDCGLRKSEINNLFTITFTAHFVFTVFGGILLDFLGPKLTFLISQVIHMASWLLIFSLPRQKWVLITCFLLVGCTSESGYIPLLTVSRYFPKNSSFIISLMGSIRSISFVIPTILSGIFKFSIFKPFHLYLIGLIYMFSGSVLSIFLGGFLLQWKFELKDPLPEKSVEIENIENVEVKSLTSEELLALFENKQSVQKPRIYPGFGSFVSVFKHPQFLEYVLLLISSSVFMTAFGFVNKSQREIFVTSDGKSVVDIFKYFNILTFLPGPFIGMLVDKVGPAMVMFILHFFGVLFYLFVGIDHYFTKFASCFFYLISGSLCVSNIYCYLNKRFPPKKFGFLLGIIFLFIGTLSLTNIPLYDLAAIRLNYLAPLNFRPVIFGLMGYMIFCCILNMGLIYFSKTRKPIHEIIETDTSFV